MLKKVSTILMSALLIASLTACGSSSTSASSTAPAIEKVNVDFNVASVDNGTFTFDYPADEWVEAPMGLPGVPVVLMEKSTGDGSVNINVSMSKPVSVPLDKFVEAIPTVFEETAPYITVDLAEIRKLGDMEVAYNENTLKYTEESIQKTIDNGILTQQAVDALGGVDTLVNLPPQKQIQMTFYKDDKDVSISATYRDDAQKDTVLKAMTTMVQTAKLK